MAENVNALILPIGADPSQFEKSIKEVKDALKSLQKDIASKPFNLVTDQQISQLKGLETTLVKLEGAVKGTSNSFEKGVDSTKKAGRALTSLSLVAQDAPFGFIGIQNNLPGVITAFGQLDTKSNGLKGALKELGSALVGPAGAFLAFSAVTAAVTFAVKEYGSLGAAVNALFGKIDALANVNKRAAKSLEDFNKEYKTVGETVASANSSVGSQILKLEALSQTVLDTTASENARKKALEELQSLDNERFKNFDIEKGKLDGLTTSVQEYTNAVLARAVADKLADRASESLVNRELQRNLYGERIKELDRLKKRVPDIEKQVADFNKELLLARELQKGQVGAALPRANKNVQDYLNLNQQIREAENNLKKVNDEYGQARKIAKDATLEALAFGGSLKKIGDTKIKLEVLSIDQQDLDAAFNLDKIISNVTKLGNTILDTNKPLKERQEALKELVAVNPQVFSGLTLEKSGLQSLKTTVEEYTRSLQVLLKEREFDARASQLNAQFLKIQEKATEDANKAEADRLSGLIELTYAQDRFGNSTDKIVKKNNTYLEQLGEIQKFNQEIIDDLTQALGTENAYEKALKDILNFEEYQKKSIDRITRNLRFLQNPLQDLFGSVLEDGIANWQQFGDAVVKEVKRIAAALLAKGVIQLLGNLLAPGLGSALGGAFKGISDQTLFDFGFGDGSRVNFSGIQSGPLQMAGAVNLSLRGSDLVASINRTNSTISRVG